MKYWYMNSNLDQLFAESRELEKEIQKRLKKISYDL